MVEIGIFSVILVAAGYWTAMFFMGRHDDVIHGKFVHSEEQTGFALPAMPTPPPRPPKRPVTVVQVANDVSVKDAAAKPVNSDALQSLLAAIQQDLKSVA